MKESEAEFYDVDAPTNTIWQLLDGRRTIHEIFNEAKQTDDTLTEKDVKDVVVSLAEEGIIESTEPEVRRKRVELASAFQLDIHILKDSSKSLKKLFRVTRILIRREELPIALGFALVGFILFYSSFVHIFENPSVFRVAGSTILGFFFYQLVVMLPVYAVHELAHAAVCDHYGAEPREIGTGLYYLAPYFYCDTSDAWRLSRRARIMISLAGPLSTVTISSFLVFWSYLLPTGYEQNVLKVAAFFGYYGTLINFSPVLETDGYYILADVLNIPNLRDEAFSYVRRLFSRALGRPVSAVRQGARRARIIALYSAISALWLAYFAYTTLWLMLIYGRDAYAAILNLTLTLLSVRAFDLTTVGVNVATLAYFGLFATGFVVMGVVASRNIRMRGVRLETIHDKRVSVFLPFPSSLKRSRGSQLVARAKKLAASYSHSYSVTLEPPLCVAALKLGKVNQSLEDMRGEMRRVEQSFRSLHRDFIHRHRGSKGLPAKKAMANNIVQLAKQFPPPERKQAVSAASQFLKRQDKIVEYLLESAFGTVWTLELTPSDYARIKRRIFPSLIAEDMGATELPGELEEFKKHTVLGTDVIAQLSSEIEEESKEIHGRPEVYQVTAFLEPMKSRLVFVGRTDKVEGSVVWLGGLYLYQAWTSYIEDALEDAALGLRSIRLSRSESLTKAQIAKLRDREVGVLAQILARMEALTKTVEDAVTKVESTYESAVNFHETLDSLVSDEAFDVGLYKPILSTNGRHLEGVREDIAKFRTEFARVSKRLAVLAAGVREEQAGRASRSSPRQSLFTRLLDAARSSRLARGSGRNRTLAYDAEIKLMFATSRLVYGVVIGSDIVL
jgi:putative peptide zinc metalloprotease protein